jgi:hypothetical protein
MTNRFAQNQVRSGRINQPGMAMMGPYNTKNVVNIANPLNSSLMFKKGKERETPKKKKPSTLKKIILKEREEKRQMKDQQISNHQLLIDVTEKVSGVTLNENNEIIISPRINLLDSNIESVIKNDKDSSDTQKTEG